MSEAAARRSGRRPRSCSARPSTGTLLRRIFAYVWPYRGRLLVSVALLPAIALLEIAQPYLLKLAIDEHIAVGRLDGLDRLACSYLLALVGQYAPASPSCT